MILAIDVGNTSTTFGLFNAGKLFRTFCIPTVKAAKTLSFKDIRSKVPKDVSKVVVCSVVPKIDGAIKREVRRMFGLAPLFVDHKNIPLKMKYPRPFELGADRLVDAYGALMIYGGPIIVVDLGTGTTFEYVDEKGRYVGGPIVAGIATANNALYSATSKLPKVPVKRSVRILPRSTVEAMQIGTYQGYVGMIDHLLGLLLKDAPRRTKVIATGGFAKLLAKDIKRIDFVDPELTLKGLASLSSLRS